MPVLLNGLSLFSSAGIGETYIGEYVSIKVANELLPNRSKLYSHFYPDVKMINGDIKNKNIFDRIINESKEHNVDFIYATPPCQSFSKAGKQQKNDDRDVLFTYIIDITLKLKPKYILIENVPEFIKLNITLNNITTTVLEVFEKELGKLYNINSDIVDSSNFGTAQKRKRAILLLSLKTGGGWNFPPKLQHIKTVRDAIEHLPSLESGESSDYHHWHRAKKHNDKHILWMKHTPSGKTAFDNAIGYYPSKDGRKIKGFTTTYKRISWDAPCPTITMANGSISSQNNVHPGNIKSDGTYDNARVLTVYELMLLTGLNDDWDIPDWANESLLRQVLGECVPPLLIKHLIDNIENKNNEVIIDNMKDDLNSKNIKELKHLCKTKGKKKYSKLKKEELIELLS